MKKIAVVMVMLFVFCRLGLAGTLSEKNPTLTVQTPPSLNWTGFYFGAFTGYKHSVVDHDLTLGGAFNQLPPVKNALEPHGAGELDNDGAELGGLLGFNYQFGSVVLGLEAAGGYLWARKSDNTGEFLLGDGVPPLAIRTSFKTHYLVTVGPRLGYACGHLLPYVTGGLAVGDLDFSQSIHNLADPSIRLGGQKTQTNAGWMVGGGLQYAFSAHWSARVQYQYVDLGHAGLDARILNMLVFRSHHEVSLIEHNASFALIYQF